LLAFSFAVFFLIITPGPGVLSAAGVGSTYGFRFGTRYIFGLFLGTNLVAILVITGVASVIFSFPYVRYFLLLISSAYIIFLAMKIAFYGSKINFLKLQSAPSVLQGIALQLINPKAYLVNLTFYSGFAFYPSNFIIEVSLKLLIGNLIWIPIHFLWLYLGILFYELPIKKISKKIIQYVMSSSLIIVVLLSIVSMEY